MTLSISHNLAALRTARNLGTNYAKLARSTSRLSSGLRITQAADDAAGLAIRELMRADIATYYQGIRNANDAISLVQTADGALSVIDEKLIRMKELAEQASTGTYNSVQRLMIDSEFQQMASEINRIANATDFNSIKLLDGTLSGIHDGSELVSTGAMKIHFGTGNDSAEDYYYIQIGDSTTSGLGLIYTDVITTTTTQTEFNKVFLDVQNGVGGRSSPSGITGYDQYPLQLPANAKNIRITSDSSVGAHKTHVVLFKKDGTQLTGPQIPLNAADNPVWNGTSTRGLWWNSDDATTITNALIAAGMNPGAVVTTNQAISSGASAAYPGLTITQPQNETFNQDEVIHFDTSPNDLILLIGGHSACNTYSKLKIEYDIDTPNKVTTVATVPMAVSTQSLAQNAMTKLNNAIVSKDKIRAHLGALQNRLENTVSNLEIMAENLQASESRISDVDVATEMTEFIRTQILTQSGVAMLAQANTLPQVAIQLIQG